MRKHGCTPAEAERVVRAAGRGYPRKIGDGKYLAVAQGQGGRWVQVIYLHSPPGTLYIIHALPL